MTTNPAVLARLEALEKMIRDATEGGCFIPPGEVLTWANELATLRACLAQQGEAVACYRAHWPGGDVGAWTNGKPNPQAVAFGTHYGLRFEYAYTHPAAVAVDEAMVGRAMEAHADEMDRQNDAESLPLMARLHECMRAALTAALQPAATSEGENNG